MDVGLSGADCLESKVTAAESKASEQWSKLVLTSVWNSSRFTA